MMFWVGCCGVRSRLRREGEAKISEWRSDGYTLLCLRVEAEAAPAPPLLAEDVVDLDVFGWCFLFMYKSNSFSLLALKEDKYGLMQESPSLSCSATMQNTADLRTKLSSWPYACSNRDTILFKFFFPPNNWNIFTIFVWASSHTHITCTYTS